MKRNLRAMSLIEVVLGLTLTVILLTAVATAFSGTTSAWQTNRDYAQNTQATRLALQNMAREIRTSQACDVGAGSTVVGTTVSGKAVLYFQDAGAWSAYVYDNQRKQLILDTDPTSRPDTPNLAEVQNRLTGTAPRAFVLARNVTSAAFSGRYLSRPDPENPGATKARCADVQISLEIDNGAQKLKLSESIMPRQSARP